MENARYMQSQPINTMVISRFVMAFVKAFCYPIAMKQKTLLPSEKRDVPLKKKRLVGRMMEWNGQNT